MQEGSASRLHHQAQAGPDFEIDDSDSSKFPTCHSGQEGFATATSWLNTVVNIAIIFTHRSAPFANPGAYFEKLAVKIRLHDVQAVESLEEPFVRL